METVTLVVPAYSAASFLRTAAILAGISEKVLTQHLRQMESDGLISRHDYGEVPPRVEYSITPHGFSLNDAVTAMSKWGKQHENWKSQRTTEPLTR